MAAKAERLGERRLARPCAYTRPRGGTRRLLAGYCAQRRCSNEANIKSRGEVKLGTGAAATGARKATSPSRSSVACFYALGASKATNFFYAEMIFKAAGRRRKGRAPLPRAAMRPRVVDEKMARAQSVRATRAWFIKNWVWSYSTRNRVNRLGARSRLLRWAWRDPVRCRRSSVAQARG